MAKANFIETKKAIDDITSAVDAQISKVDILNGKIVALNSNYAKVPSEYLKTQKDIAVSNINIVNGNKAVAESIVKLNGIRSSSTKQTREQAVAQQILRAETDRNIRANTLLGGAYAKASAQLLILKKQAKDYAIALGETHPKTLQAIKDANDLAGRINTADNAVGDFQRNVGNYSNGIVGGFKSIYAQARILANILPGIGIAGIFGLAIEPLTEYLKSLKWVQDAFGIETEAIKKSKEALEEKNKAQDEARTKLAELQGDEISHAKILLENAKNIELPYKKRLEAVKELQTRYPDYLGSLSKEQILAGDTAKEEEKLNDALVKRGIALASQQLVQEEINNSLKNQKWISDKLNEIEKQRLDLAGKLNKIDPFTRDEEQRKRYEDLALQLERLYYLEGTLKDQYKEKNKTIQDSIKFYLEQYNANSKYIGIVHEDTKATKEKQKVEEQYLTNSQKAFEANISALENQLKGIDRTSSAYDTLNGILQLQKGIYEQLFGTIKKGQEEVQKGIELTDEQVYDEYFAWLKLKEATDNYIKTLSSGQLERSLNAIGLSSAKMFLDFDENGKTTFDKLIEGADTLKEKFAITFQSVGDLAQDVFNKLSEMSNANFQIEYDNLARQKEVAIAFAGESASARAEIDRQYEIRQREIKRREFQSKKQIALFNIAIDTAQGIVAALASTPPNVPLSIAIGVIGALQAGIVASQQVPQYWQGTDNHIGGDMIINDQKGSNYKEIVETPDGKKRIYEGRNVKVNAPKGTKVYTASETMDYLMFNNDLNRILTSNNIGMPVIELNNNNIDFSPVVQAIKDKPVFSQRITNGELKDYVSNGASETEKTNKRRNFISNKV